jgi:glycosyltransferase involved in cell wall biosynthesis
VNAVLAPRPPAPLRLLFVTDTPILGPGGSERFLCNLLERLDPSRYAVDVLQLCAPLATAACLRQAPLGGHVRLDYRPIGPVYGPRALAVYRELRGWLRVGGYRVLQSQHEKADVLCALLPRYPRDLVRISNRRDCGFQKGRLLRHGFRALNQRFDRFVAPSQAVLDGLVADESVARERTLCLPNGVDCRQFQPCDWTTRPAQRTALGLPPHGFLFGCVARLVAVKRHADLLAGFAEAACERPEAALVLIGDGPLEGALKQQAERLGIADRVLFLGARGDVGRLLPLLDVFVLGSATEGMSNALLEAMACGLPAITTAVGGNPEVVEPGRTGLLVPALQPARIADAMRELLDQPARNRDLGRRARQRVLEQFSLDAMAARFMDLYDGLEPRP